MANDLATLNGYLDTALRDASNLTWASAEKDFLLTWSTARLHPRHLYQFKADDYEQGLTAGTYLYDIDADIVSITRIDLVDSDGNEFGPLTGSWETTGELTDGTGQLHISPTVVDNIGGSIRYAGAYGRYNTSTQLIPDDLVELVIARAREEALRRVLASRERYRAWAAQSQTQNVSINEMIQMITEASGTVARLDAERRTWRMPMPGRIP